MFLIGILDLELNAAAVIALGCNFRWGRWKRTRPSLRIFDPTDRSKESSLDGKSNRIENRLKTLIRKNLTEISKKIDPKNEGENWVRIHL